MPLLSRPERFPLDRVTSASVFPGTLLPELGLVPNTSYPFRVYVIECAPFFDSGSPSYYVGIIKTGDLVARLVAHFQKEGAAFTDEHDAKGIVFLYPAASLAVESFVYHALMTVLPVAAFTCGRIGGWTQTAPKSSFRRFKHILEPELEREWRMVNSLCLECGGSCKATKCKNMVASVGVPVTLAAAEPSASSSASTSRLVMPVPVVAKAPPHAQVRQSAPAAASPLPGMSDDEIFDKWYEKWSLSLVETNGWVPMSKALPALRENNGNAVRFLTGGESSKSTKVWKVGPRGTLPKSGTDWTKMKSAAGGGGGDGRAYHVKKAFLKRAVLERYRNRVLAQLAS